MKTKYTQEDLSAAEETLEKCDCCCQYHPIGFAGDCRDNNNRYASLEEYCERKLNIDSRFLNFMEELQKLVDKHNVEIEVTDDNKPYGLHGPVVEVDFCDDCSKTFNLPIYITPTKK